MADALGSSLRMSSPVTLGTATETHRLILGDGRVLAAQRVEGPDAALRAATGAALVPRLAAAGIPVPGTALVVEVGPDSWLVTAWVDGQSGRAWLGDPERAARLAREMGSVAARLPTVDATGIALPAGWESAEAIRAVAGAGLRLVRASMDPGGVGCIDRAADVVRVTFAGVAPVFAHGDFAPVNVIVGEDGALRAVIDLEAARRSVPLLDAAWWGWIVRYHHPDTWSRTWPVFLEAAGIVEDRETSAAMTALQALRCLELAASSEPAARAQWLERLRTTLRWSGSD